MTRDEFEFHMDHNCFTHAAIDLRAHDQAQREEIARLREALEGFIGLINESHGVAGFHLNGDIAEWDEFDLINQAQAALAKESTHDHAE